MEKPGAPAVAASLLTLTLTLAGCSTAADPGARAATSPPEAPDLSAVLYQSRMDLDDRQVQVKVRNDGNADVVVERMSLSSSAFDDPMPYRRQDSVVPDGRAVDMPVLLSDPVCDGATGRHTARVDYRLEDGTTGTVEVPAVDEHGAVAGLHEAECFALDAGAVATLSIRGLPRVVPRGDVLTAELLVDLTAAVPGSGGADLRVLHVGGTTLLQHVEPTTLDRLTDGLTVDVPAPHAGTESFTLTLVPNRCDAHAVAEDKQGTRFRVLVDLGGKQGVVPLASPDRVKVALYDFVRRACADAPTGTDP